MANHYTQFSVALEMPSSESVKYATVLKSRLDDARGEDITEASTIPELFWPYLETWGGFHCEPDIIDGKQCLWISHGMESGDPEAAAVFIQHLLAKFHPDGCFELSWASFCSKPRLDEFSGGAAFITADHIEYINEGMWLINQREQWLAKRKGTNEKERTDQGSEKDTG